MFVKRGSALIASAIGQFEKIAEQLDSGVADNERQASTNSLQISRLVSENDELYADADRGRKFASKLRELVG